MLYDLNFSVIQSTSLPTKAFGNAYKRHKGGSKMKLLHKIALSTLVLALSLIVAVPASADAETCAVYTMINDLTDNQIIRYDRAADASECLSMTFREGF